MRRGNQVAQAVKQSGVMNSDTMIEPGLWQSKVDVSEMNIPGHAAAICREDEAEHGARTATSRASHCITEADVKKPKEDFFGADKSCKYQHFTMGGGKIDIQMVCSEEGATQTTNMSGNVHADDLFHGHVDDRQRRRRERHEHEDARRRAARWPMHRQGR